MKKLPEQTAPAPNPGAVSASYSIALAEVAPRGRIYDTNVIMWTTDTVIAPIAAHSACSRRNAVV
jgi:hypothetical protein